MDTSSLGKMLVFGGGLLVLIGLVILGLNRWGLAGRLPGDLVIQRGNFTMYFPLATSLLISIILSIIALILRR